MNARPLSCAALLLSAAMMLGLHAAAAQAPACSYVRCALRVDVNPGPFQAPRLVQGVEARPVATIGLLSPHIPLLETGPDSVRLPYEAFRREVNTSGVLWGLGAASALSSMFFWSQAGRGHPGAMIALLGAGVGLSITALFERGRGGRSLELALYRYNEALPDAR